MLPKIHYRLKAVTATSCTFFPVRCRKSSLGDIYSQCLSYCSFSILCFYSYIHNGLSKERGLCCARWVFISLTFVFPSTRSITACVRALCVQAVPVASPLAPLLLAVGIRALLLLLHFLVWPALHREPTTEQPTPEIPDSSSQGSVTCSLGQHRGHIPVPQTLALGIT